MEPHELGQKVQIASNWSTVIQQTTLHQNQWSLADITLNIQLSTESSNQPLSLNYNNLSTPGLDWVFWKHFKAVIKDKKYLTNIVNIANTYINIDHWLSHFYYK